MTKEIDQNTLQEMYFKLALHCRSCLGIMGIHWDDPLFDAEGVWDQLSEDYGALGVANFEALRRLTREALYLEAKMHQPPKERNEK